MGMIINKRKKMYKDLMKVNTGQRVLSRDGKHTGIIRNVSAPPYFGEAGFSTRCWVLWSTGRQTLCAYKGMLEDDNGNWRIR